jgi:hypothetical protein
MLLYLQQLPSLMEDAALRKTDDEGSDPRHKRELHVDAFVYIAMNRTATQNNIDYSVETLRNIGTWRGDIYILTDKTLFCFDYLIKTHGVKLIEIPPQKSLIDIKNLKPTMFKYLPETVQSVVYLDADIIVAKSLIPFFQTTRLDVIRSRHISKRLNISSNAASFDFAMFPDAKGHYVGFCSGCEKWHTGVVVLQRKLPGEDSCMRMWSDNLLSGKFDTDQEAVDAAEQVGACPVARSLSTRYLLFAKDYIGMLLSSGQTFIHVTGAERMATQDFFYREVITPRIYKSLEPAVSRNTLTAMKASCTR